MPQQNEGFLLYFRSVLLLCALGEVIILHAPVNHSCYCYGCDEVHALSVANLLVGCAVSRKDASHAGSVLDFE